MFSSIPHELQESGLFCCWSYEERNGRKTKIPYSPVSGLPAKSNDPSTFSDFETAYFTVGYDGIGIGIFDGVCAIDLDHCITDSGSYTETAAAIVELMHSYTEKSPSGDGLHILFRAENFQYDAAQFYIMNRAAGIEVYVAGATSKYVTVTGQAVNDYPLGNRSAELQEVLNRFMRRPDSKSEIVEKCGENVVNGENTLDDDALLEKAQGSKNGEDFSRLWQGDWGSYPSHSEADLALCSHLAFWTGCNAEQMDRLFRRSGLMRDKWERPQSGTTYGALVIGKAISGCREGYSPA